MIELFVEITSHPYAIAALVLSVLGALAFLMYLWGFGGFILAHGDKEHQMHARYQMVQGLFSLAVVISIWEIIRYLAAFWEGSNDAPVLSSYIVALWVIIAAVLLVKKAMKGGASNGGGGH